MTKKQLAETKKKYLKSKGTICPYCGSKEIEGTGSLDYDGDYVSNGVVCLSCDKGWGDIYLLGDIVLDDE